jgi:hypothetical protein
MSDPVVNRFINSEGQITNWPSKAAHKEAVIEYLVTKFEDDRVYSEKEVNEIIKQWHTFVDWLLLRRELVDRGYMQRSVGGYEYRTAERGK